MLNHIIFILKSGCSAYIQMIAEDILCVKQRLLEENVTVDYIYDNEDVAKQDTLPAVKSAAVKFRENLMFNSWSNTLYVADSALMLGKLLDQGKYAIALLHEYNRQEDFGRALYAVEEIKEMEYDSFLKAYQRLAGLPWHIADTARLTIRETIVADVDEFYRIYREPSITSYTEGLYQDIEEEKSYVRDYIEKIYGFYGYGIWTVLLRETGEVIGRAGVNWRQGYQHPELGFVIAREHQRQGYGEEVCRKILAFAVSELEFDFVQVLVETENIPSLNLCRKLGFEQQENVFLREKEHALLIKKL